MYYSLVHFPQIDNTRINHFRDKYDPYRNLIDAHFTIVFPIPDIIEKDALIEHLDLRLKEWKSFKIHISGLEMAWDHWLFLILKEGKEEMIKLHDQLYQGILSSYLRKDIEFIPHIAIGLFAKKESGYDLRNPEKVELDEESYQKTLKEASEVDFDYISTVDKLSLVEVNNDFTKTTVIKEFIL